MTDKLINHWLLKGNAAWALWQFCIVARLCSPTTFNLPNSSLLSYAKVQANVSTLQLELDATVQSVVREASRFESLFAMMSGSAAYRLVKNSSLSFFSHLSPFHSSVALLSSVASPLVGLLAEVPVYEGLHRGLLKLMGHEEAGSFAEGLRTSFFNFACIKTFAQLGAGQHFLLRRLSQDLGMVLGNDLTTCLGWTPRQEGSYVKRLLQAEAMSFSMEAGMFLAQGLIGSHVLRQVCSFQSANSLTEVGLRTFAADGSGFSYHPEFNLRNRAFVSDSLSKISSPTFRSGITPARLSRYRQTLERMRDFKIPFLEGRRNLMEVLREDWVEKCEATGAEVGRIRLDDFVGGLRRDGKKVPPWVDEFIRESEANAALEVISLLRGPIGHLSADEKMRKMDKEEYLGFNFGSQTDFSLIAESLGFKNDALLKCEVDLTQIPAVREKRYYLPDELILQSGNRTHPHAAANLDTYVDFCNETQITSSRSDDAWVLQLTPEASAQFHGGTYHSYISLLHDLHVHWNVLNNFHPLMRWEQIDTYIRLHRVPANLRRNRLSDQRLGEIIEGSFRCSIAKQILKDHFPDY